MGTVPLQRPALSRRLGLSRHEVSELLSSLESRGLVQVSGTPDGLPGRSHLTYTLRADAALALGFDVGRNRLSGALCDMRGTVLAEHVEDTSKRGLGGLVSQIARIADRLCQQSGRPRFQVRSSCVGVPAPVDPAGGSLSFGALAGTLGHGRDLSLREPLAEALGGPVYVDNDVNLALLAETRQTKAPNSANMTFVALGTGIGAALLANGHLLRGAHGGAGEIAYLPLWQLEPAGTPALHDRVGEAGIRSLYVAAGGRAEASVRDIFDAASADEPAALQALDRAAEAVARGIVSLLALVDSDLVVLGGSIGARDEFIDRLRPLVSAAWSHPVVLRRSVAGNKASLLGSLEMARQNLLTELFGNA